MPAEPPLDLLASLPIALLGIAFGVTLAAIGIADDASASFLSRVGGSAAELWFYGGPAATRLAWLGAAWRARSGRRRSAWLLAEEMSVPWSAKPVRCRSPLMIGWLCVINIYGYLIVWRIWQRTAGDLRDLGVAHNIKRLRNTKPAAQAFATGPGAVLAVPPFIPLLRAPRRIREAQIALGVERPVSRHLAWLAPVWPLLCMLLQRELNRPWRAQGTELDPHGGGTGLVVTSHASPSDATSMKLVGLSGGRPKPAGIDMEPL